MLRRLIALALGIGASVGVATAGPPAPLDEPAILPWQQTNDQLLPVLAPAVGPEAPPMPRLRVPPLAEVAPTLTKLPLTIRRQVVGCVLFGVHPLLLLTPVDAALDQPCDHPAPARPQWFGVEILAAACLVCPPCPGFPCEPPPATERTVLDNLKRLVEAGELYAQGEEHRAAGRIGAALASFTKAAECCPGSSTALLARRAIDRLFAGVYRPVVGGAEETEPRPATAPPPRINGVPKPARMAVPAKRLILRVEEESSVKPDGGSEESDEPWWFLPWFEEWDRAARSG